MSSRSNHELDAYVLSESSLFVYPERLMLKTCGTTELLAAVPLLLSLAAGLHMSPRHVKYSRASFLFPEKQVRAVKLSCSVGFLTSEYSCTQRYQPALSAPAMPP